MQERLGSLTVCSVEFARQQRGGSTLYLDAL